MGLNEYIAPTPANRGPPHKELTYNGSGINDHGAGAVGYTIPHIPSKGGA
jgi:hypothetical protein